MEIFVNEPTTETLVELLDTILESLNVEESQFFLILDETIEDIAGGYASQQLVRSRTLREVIGARKQVELEADPNDNARNVAQLDSYLDRLRKEEDDIEDHTEGLRRTILPLMAWFIFMLLFYNWVRGDEIVFTYSISLYTALKAKLVLADASYYGSYTQKQLHEYLMTYKREYQDINVLLDRERMTLSFKYSQYGTLRNTWNVLEPFFRNMLQRQIMNNVVSASVKYWLGIDIAAYLTAYTTPFTLTALGFALGKFDRFVKKSFINVIKPGFYFCAVTPVKILYYSFPYNCEEYNKINRAIRSLPRERLEYRADARPPERAIEDRPRARRGSVAGGAFGFAGVGCFRSMPSALFFQRIFLLLVIVMAAGSLGHHNIYTLLTLTSSMPAEEVARNYQYHFAKSLGDYTENLRQFLLLVMPSGPPDFTDPNYVNYILPLERRAEAFIGRNYPLSLPVLIALWFASFLFNKNPEVIKQFDPYLADLKKSDVPSYLFRNPPDWMRAYTWKLEGDEKLKLTKINYEGKAQYLYGSLSEIREKLRSFDTKVRSLTNG